MIIGWWLWLAGCSGDGAAPAPVKEATAPIVAGADGAWRLSLDEPGGEKGAPRGMAFLFPPGSPISARAGELSDGSAGFTFSAAAEGNPVVCTQPLPVSGTMRVGARMRVAEVAPGPQKFMGLTVELRSRDAAGNLISPATGRYTTVRTFREPGGWEEWEAPVEPVAGAVTGEFCFRFVRSTGKIEVDSMVIAPQSAGTAAGVAAAGAEVTADGPVCPEGCCPCADADPAGSAGAEALAEVSPAGDASGEAGGRPAGGKPGERPTGGRPAGEKPAGEKPAGGKPAGEAGQKAAASPRGTSSKQVVGIPVRWEMNGSAGGLPTGFEFIPGKDPRTTVGLYRGDEQGLSIRALGGDSSVTCSERFTSAPRLIVRGRARVDAITVNPAKTNSAFVVEVRNFSADGKLLQTQSVRFQRVFTAETIIEWFEFSKDVKPPAETAFSRLCARFVEASGEAAVDWLSVSPG